MRKHQRIFPGGAGATTPPLLIKVLGGQFTSNSLPIMRYSQLENKPETPPALAEKATVTLGVVGGEVVVDSFTPGSGYTGDEATTVQVVGDGDSASLTVTYDTEDGVVSDVVVANTSDDWTEASADLPEPIGLFDIAELPDGYGYGIDTQGNVRIISHWRTQVPIWDIPGSQVDETGGFWLLIKEQVTETADDDGTFPSVVVEGR